MKVSTNLTPQELELVGTKLQTLAKGQRKPYSPDNLAEKELLEEGDKLLNMALTSLEKEVTRIISKD